MQPSELFHQIPFNKATFSKNLGRSKTWINKILVKEKNDELLANALHHLLHDILLIYRDVEIKGMAMMVPRIRIIGLVPGNLIRCCFATKTKNDDWLIQKIDSDPKYLKLFRMELMIVCNFILAYLIELSEI